VRFTNEESVDLTLPEDSIHTATLQEVKANQINWLDKTTGEPKTATLLDWWFEITSSPHGDEYVGRRVKGSTDAAMSTHPRNKFRGWYEVMLGKSIPAGMTIDTDDIVGLPVDIVIGHRQNKKDPSITYEEVTDLAPASSGGTSQSAEPPF
jgi:hypothetical protein